MITDINFWIPILLQPDVVEICYFNLWLMLSPIIKVCNIKGLRRQVSKICIGIRKMDLWLLHISFVHLLFICNMICRFYILLFSGCFLHLDSYYYSTKYFLVNIWKTFSVFLYFVEMYVELCTQRLTKRYKIRDL